MKIRIGRFFALIVFTLPFIFPRSVLAFRFVSWADTKKGTATLRSLSVQVSPLNPVFTIYPGDVCDGGPNGTCFPIWKNALNGGSSPGNGTFDKTFASRGNHDSTGTAYWVSHFDVAGVAGRIGASNLSQLNTNLTYSFDYGNSHFIGADLPGGGVSNISSSIISWIDQDLTAAEGRPGIIHAFIFFHGPIYYVDDHPNSAPPSLITVLNKHSIVSATFHGHEHVQAYVHLSSSRIAAITHPFEEFVTGSAGAELYACASGRSNYCASQPGFASIDVNGASFTVNLYQLGNANPVKSYTFTKNVATTPTPTPTATPTPTPRPTSSSTPTPSPEPTSVPSKIKKVMILNVDPIVPSQNNKRVSELLPSWFNDPHVLAQKYIDDVSEVSKGSVKYQLVDWETMDTFPIKSDGFVYTYQTWLKCRQEGVGCHDPDIDNYNILIDQFHFCDKVNSGQIDEVWMFGPGNFGFWEATMTGPGAFHTNAPAIVGTSCTKKLNIMGFNPERQVTEMLESLAHRIEGTMSYVYNEEPRFPPYSHQTNWGKFAITNYAVPGKAGCGWIHYPPNGVKDYDWSNPTKVANTCEDWLNYPNLTGAKQTFGCGKWNCDDYTWKKYWLSHLPEHSGTNPDGKLNNWWEYVVDYDCAVDHKCSTTKIGDVNGDGKVNIVDIGIVVDYYGTDVSLMPKADVNGDGVINIIDIGIIVDHYE